MRDEPKLKNVSKVKSLYGLNAIPGRSLESIAKFILATNLVRGTDQFEGSDWERCFARAIGADWTPSNVGLDDIRLELCCWGAKSVKSSSPFSQSKVRLISGRNSPHSSFGVTDITSISENELGSLVLRIWNGRVDSVRKEFNDVRTVVLLKGPLLRSGSIFEFRTVRYDPEIFRWTWNRNGNLEGRTETGVHCFTWQPHGSQFTIIESVPDKRFCFEITLPENTVALDPDELLENVGFERSWLRIF